jgi:hypothetical protein
MKAISNIVKVKVEELKEYVEAYVTNKEPLMITGAFGVGKSQIIREVAKKIAKDKGLRYSEDWNDINDNKCYVLIDMRLSQLDPSDIKGIPDLDRETKTSKWYIPNWFPTNGAGLLFFDEVNLASDSVQSACYQIVNDRELTGHKLPEGYAVVMAGNRGRDDGARVTKMQVPLLTRMGHVEIEMNFNGWLEWAMTTERINLDVTMYLQNHRENIWRYEVGSDGRDALCPRLWEKASMFINKGYKDDLLKGLLGSVLNPAIAVELIKFIELRTKYNIKAIIEGKERLPDKVDELFSVLSGVVGYYKEKPELLEKILNIEIQREEFKLLLIKNIKTIAYAIGQQEPFMKLMLKDVGGYKKMLLEINKKDD